MTATAESTWAANKERALFVASTVLLLAGGAAWLLSADHGCERAVDRRNGAGPGLLGRLDGRRDPPRPAECRRHRGAGPGRRAGGRRAVRRRDDHGDAGQRAAAGGPGGGAGPPGAEPAGRAGPARRPAATSTAAVVEVPVDDVVVGDRLLVGTGEIVPVDGRLLSPAVLDESALTGEPLPVERIAGDDVRSGVVNAGQPIDLLATAVAAAVHLRRRGAPGRAGAGLVGAVRPGRRPVRHPLRPAHARCWPGWPGRSAATRCGPSRCWSSRRRARCCSPPRSRSCPGCPGRRSSASSSRAAARWSASPAGG